jgi:hypothetical protein
MSASRVRELLQALPDSRLPASLRAWLQTGFKEWERGADLAEALDLNQPLIDRRDEMLRIVVALAPGEHRSTQAAFTLSCLHQGQRHPDPVAARFIGRIKEMPVRLPKSVRHMVRIVDADRNGQRTKISVLCPDWAVPDNRAELDETGT